jgi:predicted nucleotide-binding protein (sugar kinase/HSP70/actin superfamily)
MVEHLSATQDSDKKKLFFMPGGCGPCRQGQYSIKMKDLINERGFRDAGILALSDENAYGGLGLRWFRRAWLGLIIADLVTDVENALKALASHPASAIEKLNKEWQTVVQSLEHDNTLGVFKTVEHFAYELSRIPLRMRPQDATVISLIGEIYVRHDEFSARELIETLTTNGFVVRITPIAEYIYYANYLATMTHNNRTTSLGDRMVLRGKNVYQWVVERRIRKILSKTGMVSPHMIDIEKTINYARHLVTEDLVGETMLTLGLSLREILDDSAGIVSIGPFGCMPSRVAEAILSREMTIAGKRRSNGGNGKRYPAEISTLPYLHVETDGNPLPQITQSKIEIFMLQVNKMHEAIKREKTQSGFPASHTLVF